MLGSAGTCFSIACATCRSAGLDACSWRTPTCSAARSALAKGAWCGQQGSAVLMENSHLLGCTKRPRGKGGVVWPAGVSGHRVCRHSLSYHRHMLGLAMRARYAEVRGKIIRILQEAGYAVYWKILNTNAQGIPQSRPRFYLVGISVHRATGSFEFPPDIPAEAIDHYLDPPSPSDPGPHKGRAAMLAKLASFDAAYNKALQKHANSGLNFDTEVVIIDVYASPNWASSMRRCSPCLTAGRCRTGGHYITNRGRLMSTAEMCRLQGIPPSTFDAASGASEKDFLHAVGNAMSVNVLMRLLPRILVAAGLREAAQVGALPETFRHRLG